MSIPGARRVVSPVFYYFGIFDDLFLFQYHDREYGQAMRSFFGKINEIELKKWSIIDYKTVLGLMGVDS